MRGLFLVCLLTVGVASPAFATSTFQNTCSEIHFAYAGNQASLKAVCLTVSGTANATSLTLQGIANQNGKLVQGSGPSTFQQSCGNIEILVDGPYVTLSALCRTVNGESNSTSLSLDNITNVNGNLHQ